MNYNSYFVNIFETMMSKKIPFTIKNSNMSVEIVINPTGMAWVFAYFISSERYQVLHETSKDKCTFGEYSFNDLNEILNRILENPNISFSEVTRDFEEVGY